MTSKPQPSEADWKKTVNLYPTEARIIPAPSITHTATLSFAGYPFLTSLLPSINPWFLLLAGTFLFSTTCWRLVSMILMSENFYWPVTMPTSSPYTS